MFSPFIEVWVWLKNNTPRSFSIKQLKFISIHYIYLISLMFMGSVIIFAVGGLRYIDALFFASGGVTQAGLNTVDINQIRTSQQMVLYFVAMICNPIFINTMVVFVRLYWFEKRFQHIAKEARSYRRTKSRAKSEAKDERDPGRIERGVDGRNITVLHQNQNVAAATPGSPLSTVPEKEKSTKDLDGDFPSSSDSSDGGSDKAAPNPAFEKHRDIQFADLQVPERINILQRQSTEQHIAFLENQRNPKDKGTLRIPGPRDFDRGQVPQRIEDEEDPLFRVTSATHPDKLESGGTSGRMDNISEVNSDDHIPRRTITIDEPSRTAASSFPKAKLRKPLSNVSLPRVPSIGSAVEGLRSRGRSATWNSKNLREIDRIPYLSYTPTIGRNSAFLNLTQEQRDELGGIEYRALKTLTIILVSYFIAFHTIGWACFLGFIMHSQKHGSVVINAGQGRPWWAFFTAASMFNDLGFTLTPDSMLSFQAAAFPLLLGSFLIIIGNTGFPCMLRFIIWLMSKFAAVDSPLWEELHFLLDHPRRCFTLLFPSKATWWLFWILVLLNSIDLLKDPTVTSIAARYRVLDGWFQATSTRTAGFSVVNLANLHPAIQVSYLIMMYISVFPIAISVRRTNVYEERSLGIWGSAAEEEQEAKDPSYVGAHLRRQLSFDLWYLFLGLFIIAIAEGGHLQNVNEYAFTVFSVLFEIVSAYGTVGMSLGYPDINASFSAKFSTISKLVIIAMQIRGRHRGLPSELDRAILLPSESLHQKEDEDAQKRMLRRNSNISNVSLQGGVGGRRNSTISTVPQPYTGEDGLFRLRTAQTNKTDRRLD
ncbi:hypothetical protein FGG08_000045 [Glutinoglossum americanum]|uniref:Potassium transport protein n=1 Tax=Glutinoglossum americanum TaxID=1670608 RepID=A0A9P8L6B4_9PEZI|nr:hypothetical protein FGG08_000045 [Glutinoglossum americanum]